MKKIILVAFALLGSLAPAATAQSFWATPPTFVAIATVTPPSSGSNAFAFQNINAGVDVFVQRIDIVNVDTGAAAGGLMQWQVFASTQLLAGGTSQTAQQSYQLPLTNGAQDASSATTNVVGVSTGPVNVLLESLYPIMPAFLVNNSPSATTNNAVSYIEPGFPAVSGLKLPKNSKRALIFQKRQLGATDVIDGMVLIRVEYTTK
jgi:hypothetical protein